MYRLLRLVVRRFFWLKFQAEKVIECHFDEIVMYEVTQASHGCVRDIIKWIRGPLFGRIISEKLNFVGYELLRSNRVDDAIKIFYLLIAEFPDSANGYDSLGEAL